VFAGAAVGDQRESEFSEILIELIKRVIADWADEHPRIVRIFSGARKDSPRENNATLRIFKVPFHVLARGALAPHGTDPQNPRQFIGVICDDAVRHSELDMRSS
jgi:hypothetical protein